MPRDLPLEPYAAKRARWPTAGRPVLAHHDAELLVVYQAYHPAIDAAPVTGRVARHAG